MKTPPATSPAVNCNSGDPDEVIPALEKWVAALDPADPQHERLLLEALWIYQGLEVVEPNLLNRLLQAKDYRAREAATRVLRYWQDGIDNSIDLLAKLVEDEHIPGASGSRPGLRVQLLGASSRSCPASRKVHDGSRDSKSSGRHHELF